MKKNIIFILVSLILCSCKGYIGGFDDGNIEFRQIVLINRSSHEIDFIVKNTKWMPQDTVHLEPYNGLWKYTDKSEHIHSDMAFNWVQVVFDGKDSFFYDDGHASPIAYNPCRPLRLNDNKGYYNVIEYSDETYDKIKKSFEKMQEFDMFSIKPSLIHEDSLITAGSSEALFKQMYAIPEIWDKLKLGSIISKEAESLDKICILENDMIKIDNIRTNENTNPIQRYNEVAAGYYCLAELSKMGLAHFGYDFATLTGRYSGEMEKFSGVMFTHAHYNWYEYFEDRDAVILDWSDKNAAIKEIAYGKLMILLVEGNDNCNKIQHTVNRVIYKSGDYENIYLDDFDFYLITRNEDGRFKCCKGGRELLDKYLDCENDEPVLPLYFSVTDFSGTQAYIHINDIELE